MEKKLGRYEIFEQIGEGGFAEVFRARDTVLGREVAVKVIRPMLMGDHQFVERFKQEAQLVASMEHPNIVSIYDFGEAEGRLYIVMNYLAGGSLRERLEQGVLSWEEALGVLRPIADALDFAHQRGIIHRDIKPANILFNAGRKPVLADFGLVKAMESSSLLSVSGGILGTPSYIAPEIWNGETAAPTSDVYALACVLVEMLTGKKLFDAPTPPAVMAKHFRVPDLPDQWPDDVPLQLTEIVKKAVAQAQTDRFQTSTAFFDTSAALALDPLADSYSLLQTAIAEERWQDAIALSESILAQDNDYQDTGALLATATAQKVEVEKATWVKQWREQAENALAVGEIGAARAAMQRWQQLAPDDTALTEMQARVAEIEQEKEAVPAVAATTTSTPLPKKEGRQGGFQWMWLAGVAALIIVIWGVTSQFRGDDNGNLASAASTVATATKEQIVLVTELPTDTPSPSHTSELTNPPSPAATKTSIVQPTLPPTEISTVQPSQTPTKTPRPTHTNTPQPTSTPIPLPTETPISTDVPIPTATSTSQPTNTPTPRPTSTSTPRPTNTSTIIPFKGANFINVISTNPVHGSTITISPPTNIELWLFGNLRVDKSIKRGGLNKGCYRAASDAPMYRAV